MTIVEASKKLCLADGPKGKICKLPIGHDTDYRATIHQFGASMFLMMARNIKLGEHK